MHETENGQQSILGLLLAAALAVAPALAKDKDTLVVVQEAEPVGLDIMQSSIQTTMSVGYNIHDTILKPQEDATRQTRHGGEMGKGGRPDLEVHPGQGGDLPQRRADQRGRGEILLRPAHERRAQKPAQGQAHQLQRGRGHRRPDVHDVDLPALCARPLHAGPVPVRGPARVRQEGRGCRVQPQPRGIRALQAGQVGQGPGDSS
ncbi:MAG: hypothetical protein MZU95_02520 [Desulfomicrobium escambiense]|nr:hypothetical protein [Desulfomicrobium escambiense]